MRVDGCFCVGCGCCVCLWLCVEGFCAKSGCVCLRSEECLVNVVCVCGC